jgi:DNA-directed RNA polymerase specialized sigma24 family protein
MFRARRCVFAEDLADATFERVVRKIGHITSGYSGDPARYFYGVAKKIHLEYQRQMLNSDKAAKVPPPTNIESMDLQMMLNQLETALDYIPKTDRDLILKYYAGTGIEKIRQRRALANDFGIQSDTLRLRVFRIRRALKKYMLQPQRD